MEINIELTFFYYLAILGSLVLSFTAFKVADCKPFNENGEDFSWKKLILGIFKHLIAISGLSVVYVTCSMFGADLAVITINGTELTIPAALNLVMLATITFYAAKLVKNAAKYFGIGEKFDNTNEVNVMPQTTFNTDPSVMEDIDETPVG